MHGETLNYIDFVSNDGHPTSLDLDKEIDRGLMLPLLRDLQGLIMSNFGNVPLGVEGFKVTLSFLGFKS